MWRHRSPHIAAIVVAAGWLGGGALAGQQPPAQSPQVFRSGAQLVEVDARVFDKDGRFVTTLTRDDFEILEDGVPQQLVALALVGPGGAALQGPRAARGAEQAAAPSAAVGQTSNQPPTTSNRQTWLFFFDLNHMTVGNGFDRARKAAADFARERFRDGDLAGVVAGDRMVNNRLSTLRDELVAAIESVKPLADKRTLGIEVTRQWPRFLNDQELLDVARNLREAVDRATNRACSDDRDQCSGPGGPANVRMELRQKAQRLTPEIEKGTLETFSAINALASGLAKMPGPKTIVLLSEGFVTSGMETTLRSIVGQVARSGARVYAIDTRGLNRGRGAGIIDQPAAADEVGGPAQFDALEDGPNSLAVDTGGMMIRNENNVGRALDTIARDTNQYYVLGYQPANTAFDGKYRTIEVRAKRPGMRVRARRGYLALEPSKMLVPQPIARDEDETVPAPTAPPPGAPPAAPPDPEPARGEPPVPAAMVASRAAGGDAAPPIEGAIRLRPDAAERVRALSEAETKAGAAETSGDEAGRGWSAYERGDLEAALPLFEQAAARPGVRAWALYALGLTHAGLGNAREAIAAWERVVSAAPEYAPAYMDLAATHASLADLSSALAVLREAEKRWPGDADIHNGIGVILVRRGALDQAIEAFIKATAAAPEEAVTHLNLGRAYELRYVRDLRYVSSQRRWVSRDSDRQKAAESYQRCIALGGPYAQQAAAALGRLWK